MQQPDFYIREDALGCSRFQFWKLPNSLQSFIVLLPSGILESPQTMGNTYHSIFYTVNGDCASVYQSPRPE